MAKPPLRWNQETVRRELIGRLQVGMLKATIFAVGEVKRGLSRGQPTRIAASGKRVGLDPSKPGEPPKIVENRLRNSITQEVKITRSSIRGFVGTNLDYGRFHELGERPFLRPPIIRNLKTIGLLITSG